MKTLRKTIGFSVLFVLLLSACGAPATRMPVPSDSYMPRPAATEAPAKPAATQAPARPAPPASVSQGPASAQSQPKSGAPTQRSNHEPYDMFFQDYGVNPSIDTEDDNLSTFALDVDTGSYTIMRNYLNEGNLPPADSVRVEEYVNYFDQDYPMPSEHQAFGINMDAGPSPFTETERYDMLGVGIQGYQVSEEDREDAALTFVIDVSGSMDMDNRLGLVKHSLELLVEQLHRSDTVGIVVYGSNARVVLDPTPGSRKGQILDAIHQLNTEGATNAEAGIRLGYRLAMQAYKPGAINRVILCSDGVANVGNTEANVILSEVKGYVDEGITMATFGFGMDNYNDTLMEQLADNGDGFYAYIDDVDEARRLFVDELTSTLQTIAMNAKVQIDFNPEVVKRYRLVGFENRAIADEDFRDNSVDAGEIGAGHTVTALYEIKLYPDAYGRVATVNMRWEDPNTRAVTEISKDFDVHEIVSDFRETSPYFQRAVVVAEYAEILKESYWAEDSSLSAVYREAVRLNEYLYHDEAMGEFVDLVRQAKRLKG